MAINQSEQLAPVREMRISVEQHGEVEVDARAAGKAPDHRIRATAGHRRPAM